MSRTMLDLCTQKKTRPVRENGRAYCWGTWTRTKNKRIRIFRVANYTIPHCIRTEALTESQH
ncbi:protein of unknown function [Agreia sp. COWG]|nr:protein of unknown function [Agreia sp. COWG]